MTEEDKLRNLEVKTALIHSDLEYHMKDQASINERLTDMLGEIKETVYGDKNNPEGGLVFQTSENTRYITKKLNNKSEYITYGVRVLILIMLTWIVNNMFSIMSYLESVKDIVSK